MTTGFIVTYTRDADARIVGEVERRLQGIGATGVVHDPAARRFAVTLADDDAAAPDRLRQELEPVSAALVAIAPDRADKVLDVSGKWNTAFTNMLRETNAAAWGNWDFDPQIRAGAVGILNPDTGSFTYVATLPDANILEDVSYSAWELESASTAFSSSEVAFSGGYKDPSSGTEVKVGLEVSWSFASANAIVSRATVSGRSAVDDFGVLLAANWDWLLTRARSVGYADADGIIQGFGVVTQATSCIGGLNIGSIEEKSAFSLVGSVDGVTAMTGGGTASAGVKGSYKDKKESKAFNNHSWPVDHNTVAPGTGEVALTFQFTSFHGKTIMPTWARRIGNFTINFDNGHGGTYVGRCYVEYAEPGSTGRVTRKVTVAGGAQSSIGGIPLGAHDLKIHVDFAAGGDSYFDIPSPVTQWLNGTCTVDLGGVWPWGSTAEIRR